jgi:hypothetical protein
MNRLRRVATALIVLVGASIAIGTAGPGTGLGGGL